MKLQEISKKHVIIGLLLIILLLFIYFYSNKQENIIDNKDYYNKTIETYANTYPQRGVFGFYIDSEETRNKISDMKVNFQPNQIFILYDVVNNKMMVFDFDNAIAIYDFSISNNNMTIYTPLKKPDVSYYTLRIISNQVDYNLNINYQMNDGTSIGSGFQLNKMDLFNLNNFNNYLLNNLQSFDKIISTFDSTQPLQIIPKYNSINESRNIGINVSTPAVSTNTPTPTGSMSASSVTLQRRPNPLTECISQEVFQSVQSDVDKLYKPHNPSNALDGINGFFLNYNNYNIIKTQIDLFKTFTDDQIICILESNTPDFCNKLNISLSDDSDRDNLTKIINGVKTSHEILSLYQTQLLDIKNIVLPRILNIINKCNTLTKNNKLKALNGLRDLLYTAEYISYILGNNWDLIKNIDNSIKNLN